MFISPSAHLEVYDKVLESCSNLESINHPQDFLFFLTKSQLGTDIENIKIKWGIFKDLPLSNWLGCL